MVLVSWKFSFFCPVRLTVTKFLISRIRDRILYKLRKYYWVPTRVHRCPPRYADKVSTSSRTFIKEGKSTHHMKSKRKKNLQQICGPDIDMRIEHFDSGRLDTRENTMVSFVYGNSLNTTVGLFTRLENSSAFHRIILSIFLTIIHNSKLTEVLILNLDQKWILK